MTDKVQVEGLYKSFDVQKGKGRPAVPILKDFSLDIREGEFLSVIGPSGCGKSTFLNILAGLDDADGGTIQIDGKPFQKKSFDRGMVFQGYALLPWRTILENLEIGLEIRHVPSKERKEIARHYLDLVGLTPFADHYPSQLSGGMRQRVAIARVLAYEPKLLLMDEPFAALDAQTREILQLELLKIWEHDRKTIIFITHSIDEAILLSDRIALMTSHPGYIKGIIDVNLPRPRDEAVRDTPEFAQLRHDIWSQLREEVLKSQNFERRTS